MYSTHSFHLYTKHAYEVLTMVFGSFIAGSSPEGSAAIAYPIFTLLLKIDPAEARNFAFAIQSIGMTSASLLILGLAIKVEWNYIRYVAIGGLLGLLIGNYWVVPLISPPLAKLFFVSLWLGFGVVLWKENRSSRAVFNSLSSVSSSDILRLLFFGLVGGIISSIFGTGINIFTFCLMTIYYGIDEKVAIPSSVIIMTIETIAGFFLHTAVIGDFQTNVFEMWIVCMPVVVVFAPLGAFVISKVPRKSVATFLYCILIVQFFGAMWVIKPGLNQMMLSLSVLISGILIFLYLSKLRKKQLVSET
jgi:uncharacterized membrane protein YfcA